LGRKKLTYKYVKDTFEKRGYTLLDKEYINAQVKLNYMCSNGHIHSIKYGHFSQNHGCPYCAGLRTPDISTVQKIFEINGYTLLSKKHVNNQTKLEYLCPNQHKHSITWSSFKNGVRCPFCAGNGIPDTKDIEEAFSKDGYTLSTTKYKNAFGPLESMCSNGHKYITSWNNWQQGKRCNTCYKLSKFGAGNPSWLGGISYEPYCPIWTDKEYKEDIKLRDGNRCLNPHCNSKNPNDLTIHHIDYNKKNCHPNNLITVCRSCNARANYNREWHTAWYQALLYMRYNYNYEQRLDK
jgi:hypothetical protein